MGLSFTHPWALVALLLLVPLTIAAARGSRAYLPPARRRTALIVRLLLLLLLVFAAAGTRVVQAADHLAVVFLLDRSDSVAPAQQAAAVDWVRGALTQMGRQDQAGVVAFGTTAVVDRPLSADTTLPDVASRPGSTYSNLADAIRLGTALFPPDVQGRLVLLSDGNENLDSAESAARLAAARGVQLDVVPLAVPPGREVLVEDVTAPATARAGERFDLRITLRSTSATTATLRLLADGALVGSQAVPLTAGSTTFVQALPAQGKGFHRYSVEIVPEAGADTHPENNHYEAYTFVLDRPRLLLVEGHADEAAPLVPALTAAGVDSERVAAGALPTDLTRLAGYDAVALVDVPLPSLPAGGQTALQSYVRDLGRGLLVLGGDESYGAGGYFRSTLEQMLPVTMDLPSPLEIPAVAMVLVIDRSGSMAESQGTGASATVPKIELAKEAAFQAVSQLSSQDSVGVVAFDTQANWVVPLQPLGDPAALRGQIGSLGAGGGTYIYSGLAEAVAALEKSSARAKHIVMLTDGVSEGGDYPGLLKQMEADHITLSTVGLGSDVDRALLSSLAAQGGGRFYDTQDAGSLPSIFAHESHLASRSYLIEHAFTPRRSAPSPILQDLGGLPPLLGYVGTTARPAATLALVSDTGDPILAHWQYGLGRVLAWTSDAKGQWAQQWLPWSGFPTFWGAAARWAMGTEAGGTLQPSVTLDQAQGHISLDAVAGGEPINGLTAVAGVVPPAGAASVPSSTLTLRQTAPGHYEGTFPAAAEGVYLVRIQAGGGAGAPGGSATAGLVVPYSPEYRALPGNTGLLGRLAEATAGQALPLDATGAAAVFRHDLPPVEHATDLWPWLLLLGILLFPLDIGLRRIVLGPRDLPRFWAEVRGRLRPAPLPAVPSDAAAAAALQPLFAARRRAEQRVHRPQAEEVAAHLDRAAAAAAQPPPTGPAPLQAPQTGTQLTGRTSGRPAEPPPPAQPPAEPGNLAGELLRRRRERDDR